MSLSIFESRFSFLFDVFSLSFWISSANCVLPFAYIIFASIHLFLSEFLILWYFVHWVQAAVRVKNRKLSFAFLIKLKTGIRGAGGGDP